MEQYIRQIIKKYNDLFDENTSMEKVNVGFTNLIYILDKKFILKICSNYENEKEFENEINFYNKNEGNNLIPKLYYYDDSKKDIPYVYEIIEKVEEMYKIIRR